MNKKISNQDKKEESYLKFEREIFIVKESNNNQYININVIDVFVTSLLMDFDYTMGIKLLYIVKAIGAKKYRTAIELVKS